MAFIFLLYFPFHTMHGVNEIRGTFANERDFIYLNCIFLLLSYAFRLKMSILAIAMHSSNEPCGNAIIE